MTRRIAPLLALLLIAACGSRAVPEVLPSDPAVPTQSDASSQPATPGAASPSSLPAVDPSVGATEQPGTFVAFEQLRRAEAGLLVRWQRPALSLTWTGAASTTDLVTLRRAIDSLAAVPGVPTIAFDGESSVGDIVFHFVGKEGWESVLGDSGPFDSADGMTRYRYEEDGLVHASIAVDVTSTQLQRNRTITHELLHALGLGHHRCATASLYEGNDYDPDWVYKPYDTALLAAWYAPDPYAALPDLPCPTRAWESVNFEGSTLWCSSDDRCYTVDEVSGVRLDDVVYFRRGSGLLAFDPDRFVEVRSEGVLLLCEIPSPAEVGGCVPAPASSVSDPVFWFDGATVFDADPRRFVVFSFEGRRLLCERPESGSRGRCQFTDGDEVSVADVYTDGTSLYDSP